MPDTAAKVVQTAVDGTGHASQPFRTTVDRVYAHYSAAIEGLPHRTLVDASRRAWQAQRGDLFAFVRPLLTALAERGYITVLISGSPHEAVTEAAAGLGVTHSYGAKPSVVNGYCRGPLEQTPGYPEEKIRCLNHFARQTPLDLTRSLALGNSASDIGVLAAVGTPVAFEPDAELTAAARHHGWRRADRSTALRVCLKHADPAA